VIPVRVDECFKSVFECPPFLNKKIRVVSGIKVDAAGKFRRC